MWRSLNSLAVMCTRRPAWWSQSGANCFECCPERARLQGFKVLLSSNTLDKAEVSRLVLLHWLLRSCQFLKLATTQPEDPHGSHSQSFFCHACQRITMLPTWMSCLDSALCKHTNRSLFPSHRGMGLHVVVHPADGCGDGICSWRWTGTVHSTPTKSMMVTIAEDFVLLSRRTTFCAFWGMV